MNISVYTLTSELHDEQAVSAVTKEFLNSLKIKLDFKGADYQCGDSYPVSTGKCGRQEIRLRTHNPIQCVTSKYDDKLSVIFIQATI